MAPSRAEFSAALDARLARADAAGLPWLDVQAGDLHRDVGGYPSQSEQRMPVCCGVMRAVMDERDQCLHSPPKGNGPRLLIRYLLPRNGRVPASTPENVETSTPTPVSRSTRAEAGCFAHQSSSTTLVALVACVKSKRSEPCAAADLYTSTLFRLSRRVVEQLDVPWFILSAEHGLVRPDARLAPYERTLSQMSASERRAWGVRVAQQLAKVLPADATVLFLAGRVYQAPLRGFLAERGHEMLDPMMGLGIGRRMAWLKKQAGV